MSLRVRVACSGPGYPSLPEAKTGQGYKEFSFVCQVPCPDENSFMAKGVVNHPRSIASTVYGPE
jgi:hypothetical protein